MLQSGLGSHAPVGGACGKHLDQREALALDLVLESLLDGLLGVLDVLDVIYSHAGDVLGTFQYSLCFYL